MEPPIYFERGKRSRNSANRFLFFFDRVYAIEKTLQNPEPAN